MSPALVILAAFLLLSLGLGVLSHRGQPSSLEQWSVGGRGFGAIFVFLLIAGEVYTTFSLLGGSGWAYGKGAPAFYILCYGTIAYSWSYFILPAIWRFATERKLHSQADYFVAKFDSPGLGLLVSLVSVAALMPYLVLQLKGLGIIVSEVSYGRITQPQAIWIGIAALVTYVILSGVRGSAWNALVKDIMVLAVVVGLGIYLPLHYYGGYQAMFEAIDRAKPGFLTLPAHGMSSSWFVSTVLLSALGFWMWPHAFGSIYTARSQRVLRRNAIFMPLYQLVLMFVFFTGFAAVLRVPGLKGADADLSLLRLAKQTFSPWIVGWIGGAGLLTALVPGSMILITAGTILSKNVYRPAAPAASEQSLTVFAKAMVPIFGLGAALLTLHGGNAIVPLLLMGYNLVTQLCPAMLLSLGARPLVTRQGVIAGILAAESVVAWFTISGATLAKLLPAWPPAITDLNIGIVALIVNVVVLLGVTALTLPRRLAA